MSYASVYVCENKLYVCTRERREATDIDKKSIKITLKTVLYFLRKLTLPTMELQRNEPYFTLDNEAANEMKKLEKKPEKIQVILSLESINEMEKLHQILSCFHGMFCLSSKQKKAKNIEEGFVYVV